MNDLMSGGVHRLWKTAMVDWLNPRPGLKLLDTAGGTGDIAFRVLDRLEPGAGEAIVCHLTAELLAVGRDRAIGRGLVQGPAGVCVDAPRLPMPDPSVTAPRLARGLPKLGIASVRVRVWPSVSRLGDASQLKKT